MRHGDYIVIDEIGTFGMTSREKRKRIQEDEDLARKRTFNRYTINHRWNRRKKFKKRWKEIMDIRRAEGKKEWSFKHWMKVIGRKY